MRRGASIPRAHVRPIRIALHCRTQHYVEECRSKLYPNSEAAAGRGGLDGVDEEAGTDDDQREQRDADA